MTAAEMYQRFKYYTNTVFDNTFTEFEPEEVELALNDYQITFVKERYGLRNMTQHSVEETQKRTDDLRALFKVATPAPAAPAANRPNSKDIALPGDYLFSISEIATIVYTGCTGKRVPVEIITHDELSVSLVNPYKKPNKRKCLRFMEGDTIVVFHGSGITLQSYELSYISNPSAISILNGVDCMLPVHTHDEIVKGAAQLAISLIGDARKPPVNLTSLQE
jgi:hypothetical protein